MSRLALPSRWLPYALLPLLLPSCFLYESAPLNGANLFRRERCIDCHGTDGFGTSNGPSLDGLASSWSKEELARYLIDPERVLPDRPRLAEIADSHAAHMPAFGHLSARERRALAAFALKLHR
jgi:mono/diheme cytochrome c family protein